MTSSKNAIMSKYSHGEPEPVSSTNPKPVPQRQNEDHNGTVEVLLERLSSEHSTVMMDKLAANPDSKDPLQQKSYSEDSSSSIIDKALLLYPEDTWADKFSDALEKDFYIDLRFPGLKFQELVATVPRGLIDSPEEASELFLHLLPWIDLFKKCLEYSDNPIKFADNIMEFNGLFKCFAFFQPQTNQQYDLHKERLSELERLSWLLRQQKTDENLLTLEIEVAKELSITHYQLTQMNLKRIKELEEEQDNTVFHSPDIFKQILTRAETNDSRV